MDFKYIKQGGNGMSIVSQVETNAAAGAYDASQVQQKKKSQVTGKVIGAPELSEEGQKYYEELKKKYSNMEFILVSEDMKDVAKAQAGSYANPNKMVVLIDEEKVERMAVDEQYRKQYESIISNAGRQMPMLQKSLSSKKNVMGYGMELQKNGLTSFFAVLKNSSSAQKKRIAKKAEQKKADAKKEAKEAEKERLENMKDAQKADYDDEDTIVVTASSIDELLRKIDDINYSFLSDNIETESEKMVGRHFDSRW